MSIRVMDLVWDRFPGSTSETFVLLSLADWGNDLGRHIYPSVATIAAKTRITYRHTQRILKKLRGDGWIHCVAFEQGGRGHTRHYEIDLDKLRNRPSIKGNSSEPLDEADNNHIGNKNKAPNGVDQTDQPGVLHRQNDNQQAEAQTNPDQVFATQQVCQIPEKGLENKGAESDTHGRNNRVMSVTDVNLKNQRVAHKSIKDGMNDTRTVKNRYEDSVLTSFVTEPYLYLNKLHSTALDDQSQIDPPPEKLFATATSCSDAVSLSDKNIDKKKPKTSLPTMPYIEPPGLDDSEFIKYENRSIIDKAAYVLAVLNSCTGKKFRLRNPKGALTAATEQIIALIRDGYSREDFGMVIEGKTEEWEGDRKTAQWLRPATLFCKKNFEMYLGEVVA